ncbi:MAG: hypothetical protein ACKPKO_37000, partial [Candidatus Fonsibacter sp.]
FNHIQSIFGARLLLRDGRFRLVVDVESDVSFHNAVQLTSGLVDTVKAQFGRWRKRRPAPTAHGGEGR